MSIFVDEQEAGKRLDKFLADRFPDYSRTYFQGLVEKGLVLLNGRIAKKRILVNTADEIEVEFALSEGINLAPENIPLDILFEDDAIIVINKPPAMVVHPGAGCFSRTFVNALLFHCNIETQQENLRPGIVHRLDKDTSGVLLAAKTEFAQRELVKQFSERKVEKYYYAICIGKVEKKIIQTLIGRNPVNRQQMAVLKDKGKEAITEILDAIYDGKLSFVKLKPLTGRTHQLRVHLKAIGAPILGDKVYGNFFLNEKYHVQRQLLHAEKLIFLHPTSRKLLEIKAKVPDDMQIFIDKIDLLHN